MASGACKRGPEVWLAVYAVAALLTVGPGGPAAAVLERSAAERDAAAMHVDDCAGERDDDACPGELPGGSCPPRCHFCVCCPSTLHAMTPRAAPPARWFAEGTIPQLGLRTPAKTTPHRLFRPPRLAVIG